MPLQIIRQDITKIICDAIVNPTNIWLLPTGGTDAAIHSVAGAELFYAVREIDRIETGEAVITKGYDLPAKYVIHTAGPIWEGGTNGERELLISCYQNVLQVAKKNDWESIAIPLIASGSYGFPKEQVLKIAMQTISDFLFDNEMMVYLVVYDKKAYEFSEKLFSGIEAYIDDYYVLHHSDNYQDTAYLISRYENEQAIHPEIKSGIFEKCADAEYIPEEKISSAVLSEDETDGLWEGFAEPCAPKMAVSLDDFIKLDESFSLKLLKLIDAKGMDEIRCYKHANVSKQTWYKILNDKFYKPNKKTVISFAISLKLTLEETQDLLKSVGFILSNSSLFDVIIMYCLENGIYDVFEIDSILFKYDQETLFSKA